MAEPDRFRIGHFYPVHGDTAIAELWHGEICWAQVALMDIALDAVGDRRLANSRFVVTFSSWPQPDVSWFDLSVVEEQIESAKAWLVENERGRDHVP